MIHGLDLSHWDGSVEWPLVPDVYKFVFIKATEGNYTPDHLADQHWIGAGKEGILRGAYHFWRAAASPKAQAKEFHDRVLWLEGQGGEMELPPVVDIEDTRAPKLTCLPAIRAMLTEVELLFGRTPIIYTARWYTDPWIGNCAWMLPYPLWVAQYSYNTNVLPTYMPRGLTRWTFWQWTDDLEIPGIAENNEDGDVFNGTLDELRAFAGVAHALTLVDKVDRLWLAHPELAEA